MDFKDIINHLKSPTVHYDQKGNKKFSIYDHNGTSRRWAVGCATALGGLIGLTSSLAMGIFLGFAAYYATTAHLKQKTYKAHQSLLGKGLEIGKKITLSINQTVENVNRSISGENASDFYAKKALQSRSVDEFLDNTWKAVKSVFKDISIFFQNL